jgi:hypothetical protein
MIRSRSYSTIARIGSRREVNLLSIDCNEVLRITNNLYQAINVLIEEISESIQHNETPDDEVKLTVEEKLSRLEKWQISINKRLNLN